MDEVKSTGSEDFAWYQTKIPGMYFNLGSLAEGAKFYPNHSPYYAVDEAALIVGPCDGQFGFEFSGTDETVNFSQA